MKAPISLPLHIPCWDNFREKQQKEIRKRPTQNEPNFCSFTVSVNK